LLRQVGLRQPKGWWGPARNLILKLQKFNKKLKLNTKLQKLQKLKIQKARLFAIEPIEPICCGCFTAKSAHI